MVSPARLGKYAVSEVLGRGAMGVVYKGFDPHIQRPVALKTIRRELVDEEQAAELLARFRNEAQAAGRLSHPGIVSVYEWGEDGEVVFLAMEYVEGDSLREYFVRGTRFAAADTVSIMAQLLDALQHAHDQSVWHRDIKPANIIVMKSGKLKIADFGIARIETSTLTQLGAAMGTPGYMAPEQYRGASVDWRTDIFSAGVVLYQLLTGKRPFTGTADAIGYQICHERPLRPSEAAPESCTSQFDEVTMQALAKEPGERYSTAAAFRDALLAAYAAPVKPAVSEDTIISELGRPAGRRESWPPTGGSGFSLPSREIRGEPGGTLSQAGQHGSGTMMPAGWDAALLKQVEQQLSRLVGPLARVMVKRAAAGTTDVERLYLALAEDLTNPEDRAAFLAGRVDLRGVELRSAGPGTGIGTRGTGTGSGGPLTAEAVERATRRLVQELGPIARAAARKAAAQASGRRHFHRLLAEMIDDPLARDRFLRDVGSE